MGLETLKSVSFEILSSPLKKMVQMDFSFPDLKKHFD